MVSLTLCYQKVSVIFSVTFSYSFAGWTLCFVSEILPTNHELSHLFGSFSGFSILKGFFLIRSETQLLTHNSQHSICFIAMKIFFALMVDHTKNHSCWYSAQISLNHSKSLIIRLAILNLSYRLSTCLLMFSN